MPNHIVSSFDAELENLTRQVSEMGGIAEKMFGDATAALIRGDIELAQSVIAADRRLDALQREVEEQAILMLVRRQPMAIDLRETVAAIRISGDLERIGDLSKNVGKRVLAITGHMHPQRLVAGVEHMSELCQEQLKDVLDAYVRKDAEAAIDAWRRDESVDALYTSIFRELLTYMMEDPRNITFCTHLLFCAKNLERIGDHTTNIAETVHYLATGETLSMERPKQDRSAEVSGSSG